ncbi:microtubule-associated tumor suppressor 1 homolog [Centropristis striata]|uniref:microtubule-associated tumor suppressor 1 homolog n=1 Tax=Centropristis striata TaxID=184440 RepID=UPI0027E16608|nr:microtubule-associated tumor suppressor 1 homolog [Centropristis striata]
MSVPQPSKGFLVGGKNGPSMNLPLHSVGDHNGNAFPNSSSSSSYSSSCLGESSPESLRSVSSLSGGRTDSPLDYDMFEVTLMTTVMTTTEKINNLVISEWEPEEERHEDVSVGGTQTEISASNDNSVSVYLDANSYEYQQDTWNDNDDLISGSSRGRRRSSSTPDSDATEIPADKDDYDEEEALFLSVSSDTGVGRSSMTLTNSTSQSSSVCVTAELQTEGTMAMSGANNDRSELLLEGLEVACPLALLVESQAEPPASEDLRETTQILYSPSSTNPDQDGEGVASPSSVETDRCAVGPKSSQPRHTQPDRAAKTKTSTATSTIQKTAVSTAFKPSSLEAKRVSRLDSKDVVAKVGSRLTLSPPKTPNQQNTSAPANGKRAISWEEEALTGYAGKKQRSSAGQVKVAMMLKSIKGGSSNFKTSHKTTANGFAQTQRKGPAVGRTLSTSSSSVGSEVVEEVLLNPPRTDGQDKHEPTGGVRLKHRSKDVQDGPGKSLKTEAAVEKPRNLSRKVSTKLGPNARQQGRGTRVDKGPKGPDPPPGSGTGPLGQGSPGPRQIQSDGSTLGEGGHSAGSGSSKRQSQGIPKPGSAAERTAVPGPATSNKPTVNQQPVRRPDAPTSKLPVKGLPTSPSSSLLGFSEISEATNKDSPASPGRPAPTGTKPDGQASRSTLPVDIQSTAKPLISSTETTTSNNTNTTDVVSSGVAATSKPPAPKSRALSLQARPTATGLKAPTVTSHNAAKTAAANQIKTVSAASQVVTRQASQSPLQRSGSAKLSRINSTVEKNKPWEAPARPINTNSSSQVAAPARGNNQRKQHQPPAEPVSDVGNTNPTVTAVPPVATTDTSKTGSGTTGASGLGFRAKTGSRLTSKTGSRLQNASKPGATVSDRMVTTKQNQSKEQAEKKNQAINQLRKLLVQGNRRVEALATVIQHLFIEHEEALKQKERLSRELANLRNELVISSQCCEHLKKGKEEVRTSLEEALNRQEEKHKEELVQLEDRLRSFYQTEWDKVHHTYQEEADKYRILMEQQVEKLRSRQEAERKNQEVSHNQKMESLKLQYETSTQELKRIQQTELENLNKTLKDTETSLSEKICELSAENEALNEKLKVEEEGRKQILTDRNLKDSHTLYLEQELESLKVVLEIKNNQVHQKEKKLMEMDKLLETNVKLEECMKKVQQENEDYKARMDKHAALSRQLSTDQAKLQQTLQKESKVNKRLSMENEELLWKLHNGDLLASSRRLSPTSPFGSPRNSASFPITAPLSPR